MQFVLVKNEQTNISKVNFSLYSFKEFELCILYFFRDRMLQILFEQALTFNSLSAAFIYQFYKKQYCCFYKKHQPGIINNRSYHI